MDRDSLLHALRTTFADELTDQLRGLSGELVALEQATTPDERAELVRSLFRRAHGLKGAARAADLTPVEHACHALETLLGLVRDQGRSLDKADFEALFTTLDVLEDVGRQLRADPLARVEPRLLDEARSALSARAGGAPPPEPSQAGRTDDAPAPPGEPAPAAEPPSEAAPPPGPAPAGITARAALSDYDVVAPQTQETGGGEADAAPPAEPAAAEPKPDAQPAAAGRAPQEAIRVSSERLDALSLAGGELLPFVQRLTSQAEALELLAQEVRELRSRLRRSRDSGSHPEVELDPTLARIDRRLMRLANQATGDGGGLGQVVGRLRSDIRELRLVPWSGAAGGLARSARAILKERPDKDARIEVEDSGLELDQSVVATLRELLPHLVHNAIDHGIEPMGERSVQGKPPHGTVRIRAMMNHDRVEVDVEDDGRGLDPAKLAAEAERRGLRVPSSPERALELIFHPGFSTAAAVTTTSGRGVGLDLVASRVRALNGRVSVASTPGRGTRFTVRLPASLSLMRALLVGARGEIFALPALSVERVIRPRKLELLTAGGRKLFGDDSPLPVAHLGEVLGLPEGASRGTTPLAVVVRSGTRRCALIVDEALAEQELVLQPLAAHLGEVRAVTAVAALAGGELALLLEPEALVEGTLGTTFAPEPQAPEPAPKARRILLVDDSATTRTLERSILASAGYEVLTAVDGEQAWSLLQEQAPDLVISDVEMPRMNGFELTRTIRQSRRFGKLPVILLTGRHADQDRRQGLSAGANAYLVKSNFDQRALLETVAELL